MIARTVMLFLFAAPAARAEGAEKKIAFAADESIYVVQQRSYSKSGMFEVTPLFFTAVNPKFVGYYGFGLSAAYHLRENLALEVASALWTDSFYSALVQDVYIEEELTPQEVDLKRMEYFLGATLQFSALYGKLEFYGSLIDYDFYLGAGPGFASTVEPCTPNLDRCSDTVDVGRGLQSPEEGGDQYKLSGNMAVGFRAFFHRRVGIRLEVRDIVYADRTIEKSQANRVGDVTTDIRNTLMLMLGVSFMI
jgi:outer membrane beta-barrel protein